MGIPSWFFALLFVVTMAEKNYSETSLSVYIPDQNAMGSIKLACSGRGNPPHPLAHGSWILITGNEENQITQNISKDGGTLNLFSIANLSGARVACRAHAHSPHHLVTVSPPLELRVTNAHSDTHKKSYSKVRAKVDDMAEGAVKRRVGDPLDVTCSFSNMPQEKTIYVYVILQSESGHIETEVDVAMPTDRRRGKTTGRLTVRAEHHNSRVYCLARWFDCERHYTNSKALRSAPITLVVQPDSTSLWIAIGVGISGWLVAAVLLCLQLLKVGEMSNFTKILFRNGCFGSCSSARDQPGATVMPMAAARSLAAANVKLMRSSPPTESPPPPPDQVVYSNLEELRKYF